MADSAEVSRKSRQGRRKRTDRVPFPNAAFGVVAVAASAGGLAALTQILADLPRDFGAAILIVQHLDPSHPSLMASILQRRTPLTVKQAVEGEAIQPGAVYIAPPDRHLLVTPEGTLTLSRSELVHFVRPSADLLFESVAASYRDRAILVVLTGTGSDGATGVQAGKRVGSRTIVEDPATSEFPGMPSAAVHTGCADQVLPLRRIAEAIEKLVAAGEAA